ANMLSIGIIKSENSNNRLYYEVNQDYPHYTPLHEIFSDVASGSSNVEAKVDANDWTKRLKNIGDVRVLVFSGSLVKGSTSDIDVLIAGDVNKTQVKKFIRELEEEENRSLNFVVMSYQDFYYRLSIRDRFVVSITSGKHTIIADSENILKDE
ncbi:MAG: transcriptional regulator, partial [Candidatus Saccharimonadales bacterium]